MVLLQPYIKLSSVITFVILRSVKGKIYPIQMDLTNLEDIVEKAENYIKNVGELNLLVNNAGISSTPQT